MILDKIAQFPYIMLLISTLNAGRFTCQEYQQLAPVLSDYQRIATEDYNAVFLSSFPVDYYTEEDYLYYRGFSMLKTCSLLSDAAGMNEYLSRISRIGNEVTDVYLGIRPDQVTAEDLLTLTENWDDKHFEVILAYPSLKYWQNLSEAEYEEQKDTYTNFIRTTMTHLSENEWMRDRLNISFYGSEEWLVGNPMNYENDFGVNDNISHCLAMYSDNWHGYQLTPENYESRLEKFQNLLDTYRTAPRQYPDLSDWDVVFFGDSVIAFTETSSISGAFSGFTNAHTYNCGRGGSSAAMEDETSLGITAMTSAFLTKDLGAFRENPSFCDEMNNYFERSDQNRTQCFVLSFGLNDYYFGHPIASEDPYDIYTYSGALRTAIKDLKNAYPNAVILLMTPNFTSYFNDGTEAQSEAGGALSDYVNAVISLSEEENTLLFDSYHKLGIDGKNHGEYLMDGTHPNEITRFHMAQYLVETLEDYCNL